MNVKESIAGRLRRARSRKSIDQTELARRLNVTRKTVSSWESGSTQPTASALRDICITLECSADWLLFGNVPLVDQAALDELLDRTVLGRPFYEQMSMLGVALHEDARVVSAEELDRTLIKAAVHREVLEERSKGRGETGDGT